MFYTLRKTVRNVRIVLREGIFSSTAIVKPCKHSGVNETLDPLDMDGILCLVVSWFIDLHSSLESPPKYPVE